MQNSDTDQKSRERAVSAGTLYIVATPIGNLADLSDRARQVLAEVSLIAAEDTRHSGQLLADITRQGSLQPYHDFSNQAQTDKLLSRLESGESVALITDAGTPLISDPGFRLVQLAREQGIAVIPVPGACAVTAALSVAGLPTDSFAFEGFLPSKSGARQEKLRSLQDETRTVVFYESPHRVAKSLQDMLKEFGNGRLVFIAREMTKKFEEHFLGTLEEACDWIAADDYRSKGEFVVVVSGADEQVLKQNAMQRGLAMVDELRADMSLKRAVTLAAKFSGARKNELYAAALANEADD